MSTTQLTPISITDDRRPPRFRVRYVVVSFAFLLSTILYLDRSAISVIAPQIQRDYGLTPFQLGWVFSAFVWAYALFQIPIGWLGDKLGPRRVLSTIVLLWSFFTAATGLAWSFASLLAVRFLFGTAEAGATATTTKALAEWMPMAERGRAQGLFLAGMSAGAAIAPPLVTFLLLFVS